VSARRAQYRRERVHGGGNKGVVGPDAALVTCEDPGVHENLEVVGTSGCCDVSSCCDGTHATGSAALETAGGRIGISDVVAEDHLTAADRAAAGSYVGCIAGAMSRAEYLGGLAAARFADPSVTFTTEAAPGIRSAIIRAVKPGR
jgi:hypothetical protein